MHPRIASKATYRDGTSGCKLRQQRTEERETWMTDQRGTMLPHFFVAWSTASSNSSLRSLLAQLCDADGPPATNRRFTNCQPRVPSPQSALGFLLFPSCIAVRGSLSTVHRASKFGATFRAFQLTSGCCGPEAFAERCGAPRS